MTSKTLIKEKTNENREESPFGRPKVWLIQGGRFSRFTSGLSFSLSLSGSESPKVSLRPLLALRETRGVASPVSRFARHRRCLSLVTEGEEKSLHQRFRFAREREAKGDLRYPHMSMLPTLFHVTHQGFVLRLSLIKQKPCVVNNAKAAEGFGEQYSTSLFYRTGL